MSYTCVDRGTKNCPCILMEAGQCYTCTMMDKSGNGSCNCNWQGVCPYTEYIQNGCKPKAPRLGKIVTVTALKKYSEDLTVVKVQVPLGIGSDAMTLGSYMIFEVLGYKIPLSVLKAETSKDSAGERCLLLSFVVGKAGSKSQALLKNAEIYQAKLKMFGPYSNGILNVENYDCLKDTLIIAKGLAAAPFIAAWEKFRNNENVRIFLDTDKLAKEFENDYLNDIDYVPVAMKDEGNIKILKQILKDATEERPGVNVLLLVSPYYVKQLLAELENVKGIMVANSANICCGEGICGSCAYTDEEGQVVRRCKCGNGGL